MNLKKHSQTLSSWTGRLVACLLPLLLTLTANAGEQLYFYHTDHLGTPQVMTDSQGQVVWEGHFRPFGEVELTVEGVGSNLRFPGQYFDGETGSYYNYFRDYDPTTGRYLQSDPIGLDGGINTYAYVGNNPTGYSDYFGLCRLTADVGGYAGGGRPCVFLPGGGMSGGSRGGTLGGSTGGGRVTPVPIPVPVPTEKCDEEDDEKECEKQCDLAWDRNKFMCDAMAAMYGYNSKDYKACMDRVNEIYIECLQDCAKK